MMLFFTTTARVTSAAMAMPPAGLACVRALD